VNPHGDDAPIPNTTLSHMRTSRRKTAFTSVTDLPGPLSGTGRARGASRARHLHVGARSPSRTCTDVAANRRGCLRRVRVRPFGQVPAIRQAADLAGRPCPPRVARPHRHKRGPWRRLRSEAQS
jgi:hypothetical protein